MSYKTLSLMSKDTKLMERVTSCAAMEGVADPEIWVATYRWQYTITPGWDDAYAYAINMGNKEPGWDEGVISDYMILTTVQHIINAETSSTQQTE